MAETFLRERDADIRAIELYDAPEGEVYGVAGLYLNGTHLSRAQFAARLAVIEARRLAVAQELARTRYGVFQRPSGLTFQDWWTGMLFDHEREDYLDRADRLIAAYEGARA